MRRIQQPTRQFAPPIVRILRRQCDLCCRMANLAAVPTMIALSSLSR